MVRPVHNLDATGLYFGEQGAEFSRDPLNTDRWKTLSQLNPDSISDLATAQQLMKEIDPQYRSNLLPLEPILSSTGVAQDQASNH